MSNLDIKSIQNLISIFAKERDWEQFHTPKNLSMAMNIEASELMEIFQWVTPEDSFSIMNIPDKKVAIEDEMSDVLIYFLRIADLLNIDIESALLSKMKKNAQKYPISKAKGNCKKYSEFDKDLRD